MVNRYTLKNGIPVFLVENHASPVVSIQIWVRRGSAHETPPLAGISHFIEHALFKGTKKRKVGEIALEIEARGGEINAYTSFEETVYHATLASRYFNEGLDAVSDAVCNPLFDAQEMLREKEVILEEIKRSQDSPGRILSANLWSQCFPNTPYGRPVLGFVKTVSKFSAETLRSYYKKNYHSGTVSVIVVGDIDKKQALTKIAQAMEKMATGPKAPLPSVKPLPITRATKPRWAAEGRDIQNCLVQIAVPVPPINDPVIPALDIACGALGQGESSRLYQQLVKKSRLAIDAELGLVATGACGLVTLGMLVTSERLYEAIAQARLVVKETLESGLDDQDVERVKTATEADTIFSKETVDGYARRLGYYYCHFGDPEYEKHYLDHFLSIEREEAEQALANALAQAPILSIVHPLSVQVQKKSLESSVKLAGPKMKAVSPPAPDVEKIYHPPVRYVVKRINTLPAISLRLLFLGGTREEELPQYGLGNLFRRLWTSGTETLSSLQISQTLEALGASISGFCGRHTFGMQLEFLSKHWKPIQPIFEELLLAPAFAENELEIERELVLREIDAERDSPSNLCYQNFAKTLFGKHPYGRSVLGTRESVESFTQKDLKLFHQNYVHKKHLVVSTVGSLHRDRWIDELQEILGPLRDLGNDPKPLTKVERPKKIETITDVKKPLYQSHLMIGFLAPSLKDSDRFALRLLSSALSGQGGRLFLELRDKQSLAYTVSPMSSEGPETGYYAIYIGCSPEKVSQAIRGIRIELDKVLSKPLPKRELARAQEYWIGRFELDKQRYSSQAMLFGLDEIYGLGYDHSLKLPQTIKQLTAADLQKTAQKYLDPDHCVISLVHPEPFDGKRLLETWG